MKNFFARLIPYGLIAFGGFLTLVSSSVLGTAFGVLVFARGAYMYHRQSGE